MSNLEAEYTLITMLAEQRWKLQQQLLEIDEQLHQHSHNFYVADDGLVEVGLGVV